MYEIQRPKLYIQPLHKHLRSNKKREQMQEGNRYLEKYTEIERENRILLEKIRKIMKTNRHSYIPNGDKLINPPPPRSRAQKIIQKSDDSPKYFQSKESLPNFPKIQQTPNLKKNTSIEQMNTYFSNHSHSVSIDRPRRLSPLIVDIKELVYQKNLVMDGRNFSVEITKGKDKVRIVANDSKTFTTYSIEISKKEALEFMGGKENWDLIVKNLQLDGTELSLLQEHYCS